MRRLQITKSHPPGEMSEPAGQLVVLLSQWAALGSAGLSPAAANLHPLIARNARFVASLARQHQQRGVSQAALLTAAHGALITLLNQYAHRSDKLDEVLTLALRNAMLAAVETPAGGPR